MNFKRKYQEILRRLEISNRLQKKPRSKKEEEHHQKGLQGQNTLITFDELNALAKEGREFFLQPDQNGN